MDTTTPRRPYRARVIEDCRIIGFPCTALADAATRRFMAPINDEDFEPEAEGGDFACASPTSLIDDTSVGTVQ